MVSVHAGGCLKDHGVVALLGRPVLLPGQNPLLRPHVVDRIVIKRSFMMKSFWFMEA